MLMLKKTRKEKKAETRLRLVESGLEVFADKGFMGATMGDIGAQGNVAHGTVFLHFPTREDLIVAVLDAFGERLSAAFGDAVAQEDSVRGILEAHLVTIGSFENIYSKIVKEESFLPVRVQSLFFILHAGVSDKLYRAFLSGIKEGVYQSMNCSLLFNTWISLVHYYLGHKELFVGPGQSVIRQKGGELLEHFLNLIKRKKE